LVDHHQKTLDQLPKGLTSQQAGEQRTQFGFNELTETSVNPLLKFAAYFWGPIPWMIEVAAVLSAMVHRWEDFAIIITLLLVNGCVGFWEEFQAGNAIDALKAKLALNARVKRDGQWTSIPARELVPDDVVLMRLGDIVPADVELLAGESLQIDQSALTGESLPVSKATGETVYSGSIIKQGEIEAVVTGTGANTFFGKTAKLVESTTTHSHFQQAILKVGNFLIVLAAVLVTIIFMAALFRGNPISETLQFALVLTIAAIPVAMPTVLSVTMAVGARALARQQAIVSRLAAIEELAGIDILCSDKTGTLTKNELVLGTPALMGDSTDEQVLVAAALASRAETEDPIDLAVIGGLKSPDAIAGYEVEHFTPFDPVGKRTAATVCDSNGRTLEVSKGAPQVILELVGGDSSPIAADVNDAVNAFAQRGFRSLGVAQTDPSGKWQYLGVLPLFDPPRDDSKETLDTARAMGCRVKMVTGDQQAIGQEIAEQLGLGANILDASAFSDANYQTSSKVDDLIENSDGFAQVYPEHKYHIVSVLQKHGHIVGMTGDGVNDAPALKKADCGIAVSGATDAARAAADIVLLSPGLSVVVTAIEESRRIFQRMNSYAIYRIAETIRVLVFMTLSILIFDFYPVTAVMIVLLALLNDGAILSIAYDRVKYAKFPERWQMREVLGVASFLGISGVVASFLLFYLARDVYGFSRDAIQTLIYLKLSVAGHMTVFATRTRGPFWSIRPAGILVVAVVGTQVTATLFAVYGILMPAIGWQPAIFVWIYAFAWFLVNDRIKLFAYTLFSESDTVNR